MTLMEKKQVLQGIAAYASSPLQLWRGQRMGAGTVGGGCTVIRAFWQAQWAAERAQASGGYR